MTCGWNELTERPFLNPLILDDGLGKFHVRCGDDCGLELVRPGKAQCNNQECPFQEVNDGV